MRLVTIDSRDHGGRPGVWLANDWILDLHAAPGSLTATKRLPASVVSLLAEGRDGIERVNRLLEEVQGADQGTVQRLRRAGVLLPARGTSLLPPIRRPGLVLFVPPSSEDASPRIKNPNAIAGPADTLRVPAAARHDLDAGFTIGLVLGRALFAVGAEQARAGIAAITLLGDLALAVPKGSMVVGDQFPGACPLAPALQVVDHPAVLKGLELTVRINGHVAATLRPFGDREPGATIAELSGAYGFRPGDIVALLPECNGRRIGLQPGDRVAVAAGGGAIGDAPLEMSFSVSA